ncbi:hypothetical protein Bbelb_355820 [Branchiostoma belcheri]|nr:hypothetical protein Bbelb_355820 [Branchiostoma belcheri]
MLKKYLKTSTKSGDDTIGDTVLFILQIDGLGCREELRRTARADYPESGGSREDQAGRPNRNVDGGLADSDVGAHGGGKSYTLNPRDTQSSSGYRWGQQAGNISRFYVRADHRKICTITGGPRCESFFMWSCTPDVGTRSMHSFSDSYRDDDDDRALIACRHLIAIRKQTERGSGKSLGVCSGGSSHHRQYSILNPARISETHPYAPQQNHQSLTWGSGFDRFADHQSVKTATQGRRDPIERLRVTLITRLHVNCREASQVVDLERN